MSKKKILNFDMITIQRNGDRWMQAEEPANYVLGLTQSYSNFLVEVIENIKAKNDPVLEAVLHQVLVKILEQLSTHIHCELITNQEVSAEIQYHVPDDVRRN